jgi:penicillin-binding protein activator
MKNHLLRALAIAIITPMAFTGCSTTKVAYGDNKAIETVTNEFGSTDLQMIAESMTASLLDTRMVDSRPTITLAPLRNKTSEYIDTDVIAQKIRTKLLRSGSVQFVVSALEMGTQKSELERQKDKELYDQNTAAQKGNMIAAKYRLEGDIASIVKQGAKTKDVFYQFTLSLINNQTGVIEWQDEKEIRKRTTR